MTKTLADESAAQLGLNDPTPVEPESTDNQFEARVEYWQRWLLANNDIASDPAFQTALQRHSNRATAVPIAPPTPSARPVYALTALALLAGVAIRALLATENFDAISVNFAPILFATLAAYFAWHRRLPPRVIAALTAALVVLTLAANLYPFRPQPDGASAMTLALTALHLPVLLWLALAVPYLAGRWRSSEGRMDFVRFTGATAILGLLVGLGAMFLVGLTLAVFAVTGINPWPVDAGFVWTVSMAVPGVLFAAVWLAESRQQLLAHVAPLLARVFVPLTSVMLLVMLGLLAASGPLPEADRTLLIVMDVVLVVVLALLLYAASTRLSDAPAGWFDWLQLAMVVLALAVDVVALVAIIGRIAEFGWSPNRAAGFGLNLLLLAHLVGAGWQLVRLLRGRGRFADAIAWHTRYLPAYAAWAIVVVLIFPPLFRFI